LDNASKRSKGDIMNKKWITGVAVLAVGASLAVAAPQQAKGWHGHHRRGGEMGQKFAQKLNLTDAQKQQLRDVNKQFRQDNQAFFESYRATMQQFREAKKAGDTAKVDSLKTVLQSDRAQLQQLRQAQEPKILAIFTPEQQAQYQALKAERAAKRQQRQQKHQK